MLQYPAFGTYEGKIVRILSVRDDGQRVIISNITALDGARDVPIRRARLLIRDGPALSRGDVIRGPIRLAQVPGPVVPGGFDSQFHGYFDGVGAFGNTTRRPEIIHHGTGKSLGGITDNLRKEIGTRIDAVLQSPASGIARALTIGDQSGITSETRTTMAAAGLAHILAISGLHLSLVAGGVFAMVRMFLALSYSLSQYVAVKKIGAIAGICAGLIYLSLSGASVSAIRATIMLILVFGAVLAGRRAITMRTVAIAALFVIITDPASIFRPSFQLSFAAVVALVGVYELVPSRHATERTWFKRFIGFFGGMAMTSLVAGIATALFAAYHFQQTAPLGILGNLAALPLLGFVVLPSAFVAVLLMPFGFEAVFLRVMAWGIEQILEIATVVTGWSDGFNGSPLLLPSALLIGVAALCWLAFFSGRMRLLGPLLAIPLIALFGIDRPPDILVADTTQAVAVRGENGLALLSGRSGSFAVNAWSETYQEPIASKLELAGCDKIGCFYESPRGFSIAVVKGLDAFPEDCRIADIVVSRLHAPQMCDQYAQVIDIDDLRSGGTHWLRWEAKREAFVVRPAIRDIHRPWRIGG